MFALAFPCGLCVAFFYLREPMVDLTEASLSAAKERWRNARVVDYDIRFNMNGSLFELVVRAKEVTSILVNGQRPETVDEDAYTVDGLLEILDLELENLTDPNGPMTIGRNVAYARVRFHEEMGYVERYVRSRAGWGRGASIELLQFRSGG